MEIEHQPISPRYRICTAGFWISGVALALLGLSGGLMLWVYLTMDQGLFLALQQPWFTWGVELPITAGALLGSYLLWGRWTDSHWQRRAGLLVLLNFFDSASWASSQAAELGVPLATAEHAWLIYNLVMIFGWVEFYLFADLSAEVASHLGVQAATDAGRTARKFGVAGLVVSILFFMTQTRWEAGWPLVSGPMPNVSEALMRLVTTFLRVIVALQVTTLCLIAGLACRRTARELALEEDLAGASPFGASSRPDPDHEQARFDEEVPW